MLELTSAVWGNLTGPYGSGENVPALLQQLKQAYDKETVDALFENYFFHQNTIYTVTYAAVPYLMQIACSTNYPEVQHHLFIICGIIEASRGDSGFPTDLKILDEHIGADIYNSYIEAIRKMALLGKNVRTYATTLDDNVEKRYVLAADAAYRGAYRLSDMLMMFVTGEEYIAICPHCKEDVYLWEGATQAFVQDPVLDKEQEAHKVVPASKFSDMEQMVLAEQAAVIGEHELVHDLPYLAGEVNCPSCSVNIQIWSALLEQ
ncbi:hypothetical protein P4562_16350 [Lysinibacillus xylanilyticus]|uniref:hypothetical protein n=1 Tax=Lysinibacillus xylanilyticus TaxID=582475 RepID=UPI002E1FDC32|nr:hypothetical protein [Lysinibacillus xylanilyticus]